MHRKFEGLCWTERPRPQPSVCLQHQRSLQAVGRQKPRLLVQEACWCRRGLTPDGGHVWSQPRGRDAPVRVTGSVNWLFTSLRMLPFALSPELNQASFTLNTHSCDPCADELCMWPNQSKGDFLCPLRRKKAKQGLPW